ncbi:MAG: amidohydrolase family protein, partial [Bacteroidetes bacterium]|nr:amidohydrolase family protein [Bacteroidota bacterium]
PEQMHVGGYRAVMLQYPTTGRRGRFDRRSDEDVKKAAKKALKKLNDTWDGAELYAQIDSAYTASPETGRRPEYVPAMTALLPVVRGEQTLIIRANAASDITSALEWVKERGLERVVLSGVAEGWRVADKIAEAGIPCLVGPMLSNPTRQSDRYDKAYANIGLMHKAGVKVAIRSGESENVRNLPYNAGFAAAYGLGKEEALRAVTITPAEIFGVSDEIGSLEVGKKANLFVADGDPFETKTDIHHVFIDGYKVPMESRHTRLYDEFLNRVPGLKKHGEGN